MIYVNKIPDEIINLIVKILLKIRHWINSASSSTLFFVSDNVHFSKIHIFYFITSFYSYFCNKQM